MRNTRWRALAALTAVAALTLSACGGGSSDDGNDNDGDSGASATPEFNAAIDSVYNPSDKKGGIIKMAHSSDWDTLDPGETYYGFSWNFARLYGRSLLMFRAAPGDASNELVPDLAEDLGEPSDGGKTWTYHIRKGVKYEDGTEVKAADVKYAVLRSTDKETFPNGPAYFEQFLDLPEGWKGPYKTPDMNTDSAIDDPGRLHDRLPPQAAVRRLRLPGAADPDHAGPAGQGLGCGVPQRDRLDRSLQVPGPAARQGLQAGPQRPVGPGDRPEPQGASGRLRGPAQRQRRRHRPASPDR